MLDEGGSFILDRTGPQPLLKFDDSAEIWVLYPVRGPRGDIIYKNDIGEPMLRATRLGGMTAFTLKRPMGAAAALAGSALGLKTGSLGPVALFQRLYQVSVRISRSVQHTVTVEAPEADSNSDWLIADVATVTMEAFVALASQPDTRALVARITRIQFLVGARPAVTLQGTSLIVIVAPPQGISGRPSSRRIVKTAWGR